MTPTSTSLEDEKLLPCVSGSKCGNEADFTDGNPHHLWCPAYYRPAVASALQSKDERIAELEADIDELRRLVFGRGPAEQSALEAEVARLRELLRPFGESCPADDRIPDNELLAIRSPSNGTVFNYIPVVAFRNAYATTLSPQNDATPLTTENSDV